MSDIPLARAYLQQALEAETRDVCNGLIVAALAHMTRESPDFRCPSTIPPMTREQRMRARQMRNSGYSLNTIARKLNTNIGRVSEAVNGRHR